MPLFKKKESIKPGPDPKDQSLEKERLLAEFNELEALKSKLEQTSKQAVQKGGAEQKELIQKAKDLIQRIERGKQTLESKLWPYDKEQLNREKLKEQYQSQKEIFINNNLLIELPQAKRTGFIYNHTEYPLPELEEIIRRLNQDPKTRELIKTKLEQGFIRLQITPLMPIPELKDKVGQAIVRHKQEGKLFQTKTNPQDPDQELDLNETDPLFINTDFTDDKLIYYPKEFSQNHHGMTKDQLILQTGGYLVSLIEPDPFLPKENEDIVKGKGENQRKRLKNNQTPIQYLETIQNQKEYQGEYGLTIEDWLTYFLINLEQTNQVSNDWHDQNANWLIANYLPPKDRSSSGELPGAGWSRDFRQACVVWGFSVEQDPSWGARSAVRI